MNSLKVFYKYLLVVVLMMLPIGSLLYRFIDESFSEIARLERQSKETKKLQTWIEAVDQDVQLLLKNNSNSDQYRSNYSNFKINRMGLKELHLSSNLILEGNDTGLVLNHVALNLVPDLISFLVDLNFLNESASKKNTGYSDLKQNFLSTWSQVYAIAPRLSERSPELAKSFLASARETQSVAEKLFLAFDKNSSRDEIKALLSETQKQLSFFWKSTIESLQAESVRKAQEARNYLLTSSFIVGFLLFFSFGFTLNIFFDMSRRIKKLTFVTKNVDPKQLQIQTAQFGDDEIGDLAQSFETMSIELKESFKKILFANEAKSSFVAVMSHELRTPINGIIGTTHLISETNLDEEQKLFVNTIKKSSDVLLSLINNILDISKIESGKMTTEQFSFDLSVLLKDIYDCFGFIAQQKNLKLVIDTNLSDSVLFKGDLHKIKQIMFNLISNALKFTAQGQITIKARILEETGSVCKILLAVQDQGIGIAPENIGKLFNDFAQTDSSMARKYGGTGLGLSLSKKFARLMGGDLFVKSEQGQGSEFWLELTLEKNHVDTQALHKVATKEILNLGSLEDDLKIKVLIAEDNDVNQMIIQKYLKKWGYSFVVA
jgi:signal transduction histidine kinase